MPTYIIGDLLTGKRWQFLPALAGTWSEGVNDAGDLSCTVSLRNPAVRRLDLYSSAAVGKAFLAAVEGDTILQAGPIWDHDYDRDAGKLTLRAAGLLSYFDHRLVLPVLEGRLPSDSTTDTRFMPAAPSDPDYPWPTDTRSSWQGIIVQLFEQALSWPSGEVPLTLPAVIPGDRQRAYVGAELASVAERIRELTQLENGPEVRLTPQWLPDRTGISWVAEIGTPEQPLLFSTLARAFYIGNAKSSVRGLRVNINGTRMATDAYASGGRSIGKALVSVSTNEALLDAGYPVLQAVDSSRQTVQDLETLQSYSDEMVRRGAWPTSGWSFSHDTTVRPYLASFRAGDFADARVIDDLYLPKGTTPMRILRRSGDLARQSVSLTLSPA